MTTNFNIIEIIETGEKFLAKPYWLDPSTKFTLFCKYTDGKEPKFKKWSISNEYRADVKIIGNYKTDKINFNWNDGISYK